MAKNSMTTIPVSPATLERVRALKRGGETYDDLVDRILEQYTPPRPRAEVASDR